MSRFSDGRREGRRSIEGSIVDAMGGGICKIHGKYYGHGQHGIRDCPKCDIEAYFSNCTKGEEEI